MKLENNANDERAINAMKSASINAQINGVSEMTLDEINEEIAKSRSERDEA